MKYNPGWCLIFIFLYGFWGMTNGQDLASPSPTAAPAFTFTPAPSATSVLSPAYQMEEVVVRADKEKGETWQGKDLDRLKNDGSLSSFLNNAGGLETQGLGGAKTFSKASLQGSSPEQTLILLNGQRTNEGFDLGLIPTGDIERIEVLKGPAALAYGSDAMGGAVNIITKPEEGGAKLGLSGGDFNTWQVQGSTGGWKAGAWQGYFNGSWYQTDGYTVNTDEVSGELNHESEWTLGVDHLTLRAGYVYKNGGSPNGDSLSAQDTGQFDTDDREKRNAVEASLEGEHEAGDWVLKPSISYGFADVERLNPLGPDAAAGVPVADENIYNNFGVKMGGSAQWNGPLRSLDLSGEFHVQEVQGTEGLSGGQSWDNIGSLSTQGLWGLTADLSLDLGGRLDWHETYQAVVFNPEGTLKYRLGSGQDIYFESGTGYRYPDFDELYHPSITYVTGPDTPVEFGNGETGNLDLKPETSVNLEAGTDLLWGNFLLKISGFMKNFSNLIVPAQNDLGYWTFLNVAHARQIGGEMGLRWEFWKELALNGDYTYVDSRDTDSDQLIPARMRQKFSAGLTLEPVPGVSWNLEGRFVDHNPAVYKGPQESPPVIATLDYWVLNTEFKWEVIKGTRFFLSLDNILNEAYATGQGLPMPGRTMEAGTMIEF